jgi:hypothetical protein
LGVPYYIAVIAAAGSERGDRIDLFAYVVHASPFDASAADRCVPAFLVSTRPFSARA